VKPIPLHCKLKQMIHYTEHLLSNGLRLLIHRTTDTPMAAVNLLYNVGSRDEEPDRTGFAHLFEHLMFGGSENISSYDRALEFAGGENNAFTGNDITNYYLSLPASNLETAFWLESDRMLNLAFSPKSLEVQRNVVIEEFKQRYLNQPYGDVWHLLREATYKVHPYQWPTIGKETGPIAEATIEEVKAFHNRFYTPVNAIMAVAGNVDPKTVVALAEKWFGPIPSGKPYSRNLPQEPAQTARRERTVERDVPANALFMAWHMAERKDQRYYTADLISDILAGGDSSRLTQKLVKEQPLFSDLSAFLTGDDDPGLFVISGRLNENITFEEAENAVTHEISQLIQTPPPEKELQKTKNKIESMLLFSQLKITTIALNLCIAKQLGDTSRINTELDNYLRVTPAMIRQEAALLFRPENTTVIYYKKNNTAPHA